MTEQEIQDRIDSLFANNAAPQPAINTLAPPAPAAAPQRTAPQRSAPTDEIGAIAYEIGTKYGVPEQIYTKLINAESGKNKYAVSPKGAMGVMQLMPGTAKELGVRNAFDPRQNIEGGMKYLRKNYDSLGSWPLAVAAYHAGPGAVRKAGGIPDTNDGLSTTKDYVAGITGGYTESAPTQQIPNTNEDVASKVDALFASMSSPATPAPATKEFVGPPAPTAERRAPVEIGRAHV